MGKSWLWVSKNSHDIFRSLVPTIFLWKTLGSACPTFWTLPRKYMKWDTSGKLMKYISYLCLPYFFAISFLACHLFHCHFIHCLLWFLCYFIACLVLFHSLPTAISLLFLSSLDLFHSLSAAIFLLFLSLPASILLLFLSCLFISFLPGKFSILDMCEYIM